MGKENSRAFTAQEKRLQKLKEFLQRKGGGGTVTTGPISTVARRAALGSLLGATTRLGTPGSVAAPSPVTSGSALPSGSSEGGGCYSAAQHGAGAVLQSPGGGEVGFGDHVLGLVASAGFASPVASMASVSSGQPAGWLMSPAVAALLSRPFPFLLILLALLFALLMTENPPPSSSSVPFTGADSVLRHRVGTTLLLLLLLRRRLQQVLSLLLLPLFQLQPASPVCTATTAATSSGDVFDGGKQRKPCRARLAAWQAQHGRTLSKRPAQVRPLGGLRTPRRAPATNASFWEAMAEEEEEAEVAEAMRVGFLGFQDALQKSGFPGARGHAAFWLSRAAMAGIWGTASDVVAEFEAAVAAKAQPMEELQRALVAFVERGPPPKPQPPTPQPPTPQPPSSSSSSPPGDDGDDDDDVDEEEEAVDAPLGSSTPHQGSRVRLDARYPQQQQQLLLGSVVRFTIGSSLRVAR
ncbi:unnamed protein product [Lampetra fluviatilis]